MANVNIEINTDNDAFYDDENAELSRILRDLADTIEGFPVSRIDDHIIRDFNGNTCGHVIVDNS